MKQLAAQLGMTAKSVNQWAVGAYAIPGWVPVLLDALRALPEPKRAAFIERWLEDRSGPR